MTQSKIIRDARQLPIAIQKFLAKHAGEGVSTKVLDRAFWREDQQIDDSWVAAIEFIDTDGDTGPLLYLFDNSLPEPIAVLLRDLFARYTLTKKRGRPAVPIYDRSPKEALLLQVINWIDDQVEKKRKQPPIMTVDEAIEAAAKRFSLKIETVATAYNGKRGSTRRMEKRRRAK